MQNVTLFVIANLCHIMSKYEEVVYILYTLELSKVLS